MKKTKVVEFITRLEFGGVEVMLLNYVKHFERKNELDLHVITQDINDPTCIKQFQDAGFKVHIVTHKRKSIYKNVMGIYHILKKEKFDVAHSHMTMTNFYVLFLAWLAGTKIRISHSHNAFKLEGLKQSVLWTVLKWLNKIVANVWMTCGYDAGVFLFGKKAMDSGKVLLMNNAVDVQKFKFSPAVREDIRRQLGIGEDLCVGHIGRFMDQKNHSFLIEIFADLSMKIPHAKLLLVGSGELENEIREKARQRGLSDSVIFTGNVTNSHEYYQAMDIFVLPSLFEGLPVVAIEAQASGLSCLISENVDKRCSLTSRVEFLPVDKGTEVWTNKIIESYRAGRLNDATVQIENNGYSIYTEAEKLAEVYRLKKSSL